MQTLYEDQALQITVQRQINNWIIFYRGSIFRRSPKCLSAAGLIKLASVFQGFPCM